ncbi:hypothetical protein PTSG_00651 [Salpingoeca rosetta]|uniref:Uncharacterized protein n=1 Tax=Salpingoeca rosetta (strain ATCC 50818 / BSB-021) TaxID=946362 RepID=F2TX34_SALR5|nr:uncharacterized protein PTSG_00651 [Salpingoeca rosetta]EGD75943.1 hypothetical protein PTSG_00651 [Salpingoeca rosetta]|eukprot:XP_004998119.1 hypothetical protein PTSG_00651 [Salpingoeca rosetta]
MTESQAEGGVQKFPYPTKVWSPAGGWWPAPKNWKANTIIAAAVIATVCIPAYIISERRMRYAYPFNPTCYHCQISVYLCRVLMFVRVLYDVIVHVM